MRSDTWNNGDCHWFEVSLQACCYEMATLEVADALEIRENHIQVCARHAIRAEKFSWVVVACIVRGHEL